MRVFMTGASGFIGSYLVPELRAAGHQVMALSRSARSAKTLSRMGAEVVPGELTHLECLHAAAREADAVVHAAFDHDFRNLQQRCVDDNRAIGALGDALAGSDRPLIITSGTGLVRSSADRPALETDAHVSSTEFPRAAAEEAADALMARGGRVMVVRLPQVHDTRRQGRISWHIQIAREQGRVAFVGGGANRLAAVHVSDAVRLYRLALERGQPGARYHAVAEQGVPLRDIAECIGARLHLPVESISPAQAPGYFGGIAHLAALDLAASGDITQQQLDWHPGGPDLLSDLRRLDISDS